MAGKPLLRPASFEKQSAEIKQCRDAGTALANYTCSLSSHLALPVERQPSTWGGARNRADRVSDALSDKQVAQLVAAAQFAFATGRIFQRHWTVHYGLAGIEPQNGAKFVGKLLDLVGKQARREGGKLTAIWVRECASDKGEHAHILLHLPAGMSLRNRTRRWIEAAGGRYRRGVSKVTIVGGRFTKIEENSKAHQRKNAANVVRYVLKAASAESACEFGLVRFATGGRIIGKRCGFTQSLGETSGRAEVKKPITLATLNSGQVTVSK